MEHRIWNRESECMKRAELEKLQLERLRALIDYCDKNVKFYHDRFEKNNITAERIKQLSDIQYIPYTTKEDLRDNYPFGLFLSGQQIDKMSQLFEIDNEGIPLDKLYPGYAEWVNSQGAYQAGWYKW